MANPQQLAAALSPWMTAQQMQSAYTPDSGTAQQNPGNFWQPQAAGAFSDPAWLKSLGFTGNAVNPASGGYSQESGTGQAYDTQSQELTDWLNNKGYTQKQRFGPGNSLDYQYFDQQGNPVGIDKSVTMSDPAFGAASLAAALLAGGAAAGAFGGGAEGAGAAAGEAGGAAGEAAGGAGYSLDPALFGGANAPLDLGSLPTYLTDGATFSSQVPEGLGYALDPTLFGGGLGSMPGITPDTNPLDMHLQQGQVSSPGMEPTPPVDPNVNPLDQHLAQGQVSSPGMEPSLPEYPGGNPLDQHLADGTVTTPGGLPSSIPWPSLSDVLKGLGGLAGHPGSGGGGLSIPGTGGGGQTSLGGGSQVGQTPGMQLIAQPMQQFQPMQFQPYKSPYAVGMMG
jgi:hypothetical protein